MPDSPTAVEPVVAAPIAAVTTPNTDVTTREPSTPKPQDEGSQKKPQMIDAVKAALDLKPGNPPKPDSNPDTAKPTGEPGKDPEDLSPEEQAQLSMKAQLRFRHLSNKATAAEKRAEVAETKVAEFDKFQTAMQSNRVSQDDAVRTFEIMGLMRTDPAEALNRLHPIVSSLLEAVGISLPEDLQAEVKAGKISQERAQELAAARQGTKRSAAQLEEERNSQAEQKFQSHVNSLTKAADDWVAERQTSDPDWHLKQERVVELVKLHLLENKANLPKSVQDARALFEAKLKTVEAGIAKFRPKLTATDPTLKPSGASTAATAAPKTFLDVVKQAAGAA